MPQITPIAANSSHPRLLNPHSSTSLCPQAPALAGYGACGSSVLEYCGIYRVRPELRVPAGVYRLTQTPSGPSCRQVPSPPAGGLGDGEGLGVGDGARAGAGEDSPVTAPGVRAGFALPVSVGPLPPPEPWLPEPWFPEPWFPEPWFPEPWLPEPEWELL